MEANGVVGKLRQRKMCYCALHLQICTPAWPNSMQKHFDYDLSKKLVPKQVWGKLEQNQGKSVKWPIEDNVELLKINKNPVWIPNQSKISKWKQPRKREIRGILTNSFILSLTSFNCSGESTYGTWATLYLKLYIMFPFENLSCFFMLLSVPNTSQLLWKLRSFLNFTYGKPTDSRWLFYTQISLGNNFIQAWKWMATPFTYSRQYTYYSKEMFEYCHSEL